MIITCPNCSKKFKIDNSLIPDDGRDLQCGSCNHVWFYNLETKKNEILNLTKSIDSNINEINIENKEETILKKKQPVEKIKNQINKNKKEKLPEMQKTIIKSEEVEIKGIKFLSFLIVFIISFVALVILLDTLKKPLINLFPGLEIILFNLFETLHDIKLFIIDLI